MVWVIEEKDTSARVPGWYVRDQFPSRELAEKKMQWYRDERVQLGSTRVREVKEVGQPTPYSSFPLAEQVPKPKSKPGRTPEEQARIEQKHRELISRNYDKTYGKAKAEQYLKEKYVPEEEREIIKTKQEKEETAEYAQPVVQAPNQEVLQTTVKVAPQQTSSYEMQVAKDYYSGKPYDVYGQKQSAIMPQKGTTVSVGSQMTEVELGLTARGSVVSFKSEAVPSKFQKFQSKVAGKTTMKVLPSYDKIESFGKSVEEKTFKKIFPKLYEKEYKSLEFAKGVGKGGYEFVREKPIETAAIAGTGVVFGGAGALASKSKVATTIYKVTGVGLGATYGVVKGAEIVSAPGARAKGEAVGRGIVEVGAFSVGASVGPKIVAAPAKVKASVKSYKFEKGMQRWQQSITDTSWKYEPSTRYFEPYNQVFDTTKTPSFKYAKEPVPKFIKERARAIDVFESPRDYPLFDESGAIVERQMMLKPKFDPYAEAQSRFQPERLGTENVMKGMDDYLGKWVERPLSPREQSILNEPLRIVQPEPTQMKFKRIDKPTTKTLYYAGNEPPSAKLAAEGKVYGFETAELAEGWALKKGYKEVYKFEASEFKPDVNKVYSRPVVDVSQPKGFRMITSTKPEYISTKVFSEQAIPKKLAFDIEYVEPKATINDMFKSKKGQLTIGREIERTESQFEKFTGDYYFKEAEKPRITKEMPKIDVKPRGVEITRTGIITKPRVRLAAMTRITPTLRPTQIARLYPAVGDILGSESIVSPIIKPVPTTRVAQTPIQDTALKSPISPIMDFPPFPSAPAWRPPRRPGKRPLPRETQPKPPIVPPLKFKLPSPGKMFKIPMKKPGKWKRKFKGTPSLSVVLGGKGTQLTRKQIAGKDFISPVMIRKL